MAMIGRLRRPYVIVFVLIVVAIISPIVVRMARQARGPAIEILCPDGSREEITLVQMKQMPIVARKGTYQNQFGNWRDEGLYTGARLMDLIPCNTDYTSILCSSRDGYAIEIERARVEDSDYPVILAYAFNGIEVPDWELGFRIAVLPLDGNVSNEEYNVLSAGSYWVKNVDRLVLKDSTQVSAP